MKGTTGTSASAGRTPPMERASQESPPADGNGQKFGHASGEREQTDRRNMKPKTEPNRIGPVG